MLVKPCLDSRLFTSLFGMAVVLLLGAPATAKDVVHDAEYYVLKAQHGAQWAKDDADLDKKLTALKKKFGRAPNIIHVMWDDTAFGDVGIPAMYGLEPKSPDDQKKVKGLLFTERELKVLPGYPSSMA